MRLSLRSKRSLRQAARPPNRDVVSENMEMLLVIHLKIARSVKYCGDKYRTKHRSVRQVVIVAIIGESKHQAPDIAIQEKKYNYKNNRTEQELVFGELLWVIESW